MKDDKDVGHNKLTSYKRFTFCKKVEVFYIILIMKLQTFYFHFSDFNNDFFTSLANNAIYFFCFDKKTTLVGSIISKSFFNHLVYK